MPRQPEAGPPPGGASGAPECPQRGAAGKARCHRGAGGPSPAAAAEGLLACYQQATSPAAGCPRKRGFRAFSLLLPSRHPVPGQGCINCPTYKTVAQGDYFCECIWQTDHKAPSLRQVLNNPTSGRKSPGRHFSKATPSQPFHLPGSCPSHTVISKSGGFLS